MLKMYTFLDAITAIFFLLHIGRAEEERFGLFHAATEVKEME